MGLMQYLLALPLSILPIYALVSEKNIFSMPSIFAYLIVGTVLFLIWIRLTIMDCKIEPHDALGFAFFATIHLVIALFGLRHHSLWLDEVTQYQGSVGGNFLWGSITQQQMPMTYLHSALSYEFFGFSEWAPRMMPLFWGCLSAGAMFLALNSFIPQKKLVWLVSLFFSTYPWLVRYSQEGRPTSFVIFSSVMYIYFVYTFFSEKLDAKKSGVATLALFVSCLVFLSSTFLQPTILMLTVLVSVKLIWRVSSRPWRTFFAIHFLCFALCIPHWLEIYANSAKYIKDEGIVFGEVIPQLSRIWIVSFRSHSLLLLFAFLALFVLSFQGFAVLKTKLMDPTIQFSIFSSLLFTSLITGVFITAIDWHFNARYSLSGLSLVTLSSTIAFHRALQTLSRQRGMAVLFFTFACLLSFNVYGNYRLLISGEFDRGTIDLRGLFRTVKENALPGDFVFLVHSTDYQEWRPHGLYGNEFYLKEDHQLHIQLQNQPRFPTLLKRLLSSETQLRPRHIFFVHHWPTPSPGINLAGKIAILRGVTVDRMSCTGDWLRCLKDLIACFKTQNPGESKQISVLEMELEILVHEKNCQLANEILSKLEHFHARQKDPQLFAYLNHQVTQCEVP